MEAPSQEKFASLYFPNSDVLATLKAEADKRRTSFNSLVIQVMDQVAAQMAMKRRRGQTARKFQVEL